MSDNLVPAICTQCGAILSVDADKEAAICECCKTPFIVKKAIQNYTLHIQSTNSVIIHNAVITNGQSAENFAKRANEFEERNDFVRAEEYYNKALDIDINCVIARDGLQRLNTNKVLNEARCMAIGKQTAKAIKFLQNSMMQDVDHVRIEQEINRLKQEIYGKTLYCTQAYYRFSAFQIIATDVVLSFDSNELRLSSAKKVLSIATDSIMKILPCENVNYAGEAFGRSVPNCIRVSSIDPSTGKIKKIDIRVHNAQVVAEQLNIQLQNVRGQ